MRVHYGSWHRSSDPSVEIYGSSEAKIIKQAGRATWRADEWQREPVSKRCDGAPPRKVQATRPVFTPTASVLGCHYRLSSSDLSLRALLATTLTWHRRKPARRAREGVDELRAGVARACAIRPAPREAKQTSLSSMRRTASSPGNATLLAETTLQRLLEQTFDRVSEGGLETPT